MLYGEIEEKQAHLMAEALCEWAIEKWGFDPRAGRPGPALPSGDILETLKEELWVVVNYPEHLLGGKNPLFHSVLSEYEIHGSDTLLYGVCTFKKVYASIEEAVENLMPGIIENDIARRAIRRGKLRSLRCKDGSQCHDCHIDFKSGDVWYNHAMGENPWDQGFDYRCITAAAGAQS